MRCVISQTWNGCLPYRGFDAMRLPGRLKITDAERDERIKKTVEARTCAPTRTDDNDQHT
jgi:hypothetical protein